MKRLSRASYIAAAAAAAFFLLTLHPGNHRPPGPASAEERTARLLGEARGSGDPAPARIAAIVGTNAGPGWERTFVLHDCLAAAGALAEFGRLLSFGRATPSDPRGRLDPEAARCLALADDFAARWLAAKYPALGTDAVRRIIAEPNRSVLPVAGEYNLFTPAEVARLLGLPAPPSTSASTAPFPVVTRTNGPATRR